MNGCLWLDVPCDEDKQLQIHIGVRMLHLLIYSSTTNYKEVCINQTMVILTSAVCAASILLSRWRQSAGYQNGTFKSLSSISKGRITGTY